MGFSFRKTFILSLIFLIILNPMTVSNVKKISAEDVSEFYIDEQIIKRATDQVISEYVVVQDEEIGNQEVFWSLDVSAGIYVQKLATLLSVGEKCYVYVANETITSIGESTAISRCNYYRDEFDDVIYAKNIEPLLFYLLNTL